ncbi:asialoglycoprotein receptor 1 isoform 1-T1 [Spinachia spinachia]
MTTEYHDNLENDNSSFWNQGTCLSLGLVVSEKITSCLPLPVPLSPCLSAAAPVYFSGVSRFRRWLFPGLTATIILILIIALGASSTRMSSWLWTLDRRVSNLTESLGTSQKLTKDAAKDVHRLKFAVESNTDQLTSVAEALKQLSALDSISRTVASLKCSLERIINNTADGCCPMGWDIFRSNCYFLSKTVLSWNDARDWCNGHQSHLVILIHDEEWDFVTQYVTGVSYWIGLTDERTGDWEWVNQTPYVMNRRRWSPGQPDSWTNHNLGPGDEDCAHILSNGRLNDLHCSSRLRFVCQRPS